jgi:hypothetical protein
MEGFEYDLLFCHGDCFLLSCGPYASVPLPSRRAKRVRVSTECERSAYPFLSEKYQTKYQTKPKKKMMTRCYGRRGTTRVVVRVLPWSFFFTLRGGTLNTVKNTLTHTLTLPP